MSDTCVVIDKYAKAAFNISKKSGLGQVFVKDLGIFCQSISPFLQELSNPTISKLQLENVANDLVQKLKLNTDVGYFLVSVAKARRLNLSQKICDKLESLVKKDNNIIQAEVISAIKLEKTELVKIKESLAKKYSGKEIEIKEIVKEDILGGVIIKIGSTLIDSSIKNQLSTIYADCKSAL